MTVIYGTVADFHTYLDDRALPDGYSDADVAAKLIVASEWLDARYGTLWPGRKTGGRAQERDWPRIGVSDNEGYAVDSTVVPSEVEQATYEAARRELANAGSLSVDFTPSKYLSAAVSGAVSVTYANFSAASQTQVQLQIVNEILAPLLTGANNASSLSGAACR